MCDTDNTNDTPLYTIYTITLQNKILYFVVKEDKPYRRTLLTPTISQCCSSLGSKSFNLVAPLDHPNIVKLCCFDDPKEVKEKYPEEFI